MAAVPSPFPSPLLLALLALLLLVVGFAAGIRLARRVLRHRAARTRRIGRRGERRALALLEAEGYRLLEREVVGRGRIEVDGEERAFLVRADALVRRRRRTYVAELKGGIEASRITHRATRRQLLEYAAVFPVDGVLLVDARRRRIHRVRFPERAPVKGRQSP
jgi:Holliday junction resolvase-like predicted endonuclease